MAELKKFTTLGSHVDVDVLENGSGVSKEILTMTTQPYMEGNADSSDEGRGQPKEKDGCAVSHTGHLSGALQGEHNPLTKNQRRRLRRRLRRGPAAAGADLDTSKTPAKEDIGQKRLAYELTPSPHAVKMAKSSSSPTQRLAYEVTPSPHAVKMAKRSSSPTQTFAKSTVPNKLAVVKDGFPTSRLSQEEYDCIYGNMTDLIDLIPKRRPLPKINSTNYSIGSMIISYAGSDTEEWIRTSLHNNTNILGGITLKVLDMSEMPKPVKVVFRTKDTYTRDPKKLLQRLNRYNPELKINDWKVVNYFSETQFAYWIFMVDIESAAAIRKAKFCIYAGMDKGVFKILNDPNQQEDGKGKAKDPVISTQTSTAISTFTMTAEEKLFIIEGAW